MNLPQNVIQQLSDLLSNVPQNIFVDVIIDEQNINQEITDVLELMQEISNTVPKMTVNKLDINSSEAKKHNVNIENVPAIVVYNEGQKSSFAYFGLPAEYEFSSLVEILRTVGNGQSDLGDNIIEKLKSIDVEKQVDIFVTPSCPHCPTMVIAGFRASYVNPLIKVYAYDAKSFRTYARSKSVMSVPKTIINGIENIDGNVPIDTFVEQLLKK